jgi:hypothetical protein
LRRFGTAFTVAMAGTAAFAATAQAQLPPLALSPPKACYLTGEQVAFSGGGFTPSGPVDIKVDGTSLGQIVADPAGNIANVVRLGTMRGAKSHALVATDLTNPALVSSASYLGTRNRVTVKPDNARAGTPRTIRGWGFLAGPRVYMHVRGNGYRSDKRIAKSQAPCGTFAVRKVIVPAGAGIGTYNVQFDAKRRYSKKTRPRVRGTMRVSPRASGARAAAFAGLGGGESWLAR